MRDTDWRPSPCPACGEMREAARNPVCRNVDCVNDVAKSRTFTAPRYLWLREGKLLAMIDDPMEVYRQADFNPDIDKFYQIGSEVKFKVSMEVVPGKREPYRDFNQKE
jgi:hypothetical protein